MKVTEHQKGGAEPLEDAQDQIQQDLGMQKMEPALRAYLTKLRNEASIDVRTPYFDSGATPNEIKLVQSAYTPPQTKKKKKQDERARFRQRSVRAQKPEAASAAPAGVPTLDKVNSQKASGKEVANNKGTEKPGKKEKIRFGQAPRETLPAGPTREIDAGAAGGDSAQGAEAGAQVAANQPENGVALTNAQGEVIDTSNGDQSQKKTRFSDRAKMPKAKQREIANRNKRQKFTPPPQDEQQVATDQQQQSALGLNGDSKKAAKKAKAEKAKAAKNSPKKRMSDEDKKGEPTQQQPNGTPAAAPSAVPPQL
jgi:peptidyl-prolyl cis-trans isomerase SurA